MTQKTWRGSVNILKIFLMRTRGKTGRFAKKRPVEVDIIPPEWLGIRILVVVTVGAVGMAVAQFFLRGFPNLHDFHVKVQYLTGQRMVGVQNDFLAFLLDNRSHHHAFFGLQLNHHTRFGA